MRRVAYRQAQEDGFQVWSQSKLCMFECPRAGFLRYVEKRPEPENEPARFGNLIHAAIAAIIGSGMRLEPKEAVTQAAREVLGVTVEQVLESRDLIANLKIEVDPTRVIGVEEEIVRPLSGGRAFYAGIDVLEIDGSHAIVTDWKTDRATRSLENVARDLQVRSYAWAVLDEYPYLESVTVTLYFVRYNHPVSVTFLREEVAGIGEFLDSQAREIEERISSPGSKWPAAPGERCRFCSYSLDCPAVETGKTVLMVRSSDEALAVAAELAAAERRITVLKDALKQWVNQHGSVEYGGEVWGFWTNSWYELRPGVLEKFVSLLKEKGCIPDSYLKPNGKTVPALLDDPDFAALIVRKSYPRFESRKAL